MGHRQQCSTMFDIFSSIADKVNNWERVEKKFDLLYLIKRKGPKMMTVSAFLNVPDGRCYYTKLLYYPFIQ